MQWILEAGRKGCGELTVGITTSLMIARVVACVGAAGLVAGAARGFAAGGEGVAAYCCGEDGGGLRDGGEDGGAEGEDGEGSGELHFCAVGGGLGWWYGDWDRNG